MRTMIEKSFRFGLVWAGLTVAMVTGSAQAASSSAFYVPVNRSELISVNSDISEVIVADPEVANVVVHGKRKISVIGIGVGQTSLRIMDTNHKLIRTTNVFVTYDLPAIRRALKEYFPNERIGVSMINTRIALTGEVSSAEAAANALEIATEFVRGKLKDDQADTRKRFVAAAGTQTTGEDSPIINLMKVSAGQQVMLRIKIGEVNRTALRNLGVNLQALGENGLNVIAATGVSNLPDLVGSPPLTRPGTGFASIAGNAEIGDLTLGAQIDALEENGMLKVLAEPSLTALSGEEAQFLAGGEFPIPVPQQLGGNNATSTITVQYKPYGVALKFVPYVLTKNRIRILVQPEVSDLSPENSINTGGFTIPSFVTRRASTTVELAPGESFMIAGLLRDDMTSKISQLPGADTIPVLGALFRSTAYQRRETELVIAVTPYLVDPLRDSDIKLPTDDFRPASFMESIFFGAITSNRGGKDPSLEGPAGFMTDN